MSLKSSLEALLLVSAKPITVKRLASALGTDEENVEQTMSELADDLGKREGGLAVLRSGVEVQLVTSSGTSDVVQRFLKEEQTGELTRPALETLTIIVYRTPIRKSELELIRGVNCSLILRNLLIRGLVEEEKDPETGEARFRPSLVFLKWLGVTAVEELPDYERLSNSEILKNILKQPQSTPEA